MLRDIGNTYRKTKLWKSSKSVDRPDRYKANNTKQYLTKSATKKPRKQSNDTKVFDAIGTDEKQQKNTYVQGNILTRAQLMDLAFERHTRAIYDAKIEVTGWNVFSVYAIYQKSLLSLYES